MDNHAVAARPPQRKLHLEDRRSPAEDGGDAYRATANFEMPVASLTTLPELHELRVSSPPEQETHVTRQMLRLIHRVTTTPDASPGLFFVEAGRTFDVGDYAKAHELDSGDLEPEDVLAVQAAVDNLIQGEWLRVTHETTGNK